MKSILIPILFAALNLQAQVLSGHDRGNGGDVLVCRDQIGKITSAKFYDLFEAEVKFGFTLVPAQGKTLDEKVNSIISRVEKIDPSRASIFRVWYANFFNESKFIPGVELGDIPDQGDALWPVNCKIMQLVVQTQLKPPLNPSRYTFSQDLWNLLDDNSKVATIIHELIFREARLLGQTSSTSVRYLNGLFWADRLNQISLLEYQNLILKDLKLGLVTTFVGLPYLPYRRDNLQILNNFKGMSFSIAGGQFIYNGEHELCAWINEETGGCKDHVYGIIKSMVKPPNFPSQFESKNLSDISMMGDQLHFSGLNLLEPYAFTPESVILNSEGLWTVKTGGLFILFKKSEVVDLFYMWPGPYNWTFRSLTKLQLRVADGKILKVSYIPEQSIDLEKGGYKLTCRAGLEISFENDQLSCVADKETWLANGFGPGSTKVKAGKRVLVNSILQLVKAP